MYFKLLTNILPIEIVEQICDYDDRHKLRMENVIKQIEKLNKDVEEYWHIDKCLYYMTEAEERYRLQLGLRVTNLDWPLPEKRCFRFWNTEATPTQSYVTHPRNNWWLYQYHNGCYMYPTNMTSFFKKYKK